MESLWLHWPGIIRAGVIMEEVPQNMSYMFHFHNWIFVNFFELLYKNFRKISIQIKLLKKR